MKDYIIIILISYFFFLGRIEVLIGGVGFLLGEFWFDMLFGFICWVGGGWCKLCRGILFFDLKSFLLFCFGFMLLDE